MSRFYDATMGRLFAFGYSGLMERTEAAGLRDIRRELLSGARGRTIDIGAGNGANLGLFGPEVTELVLAEPEPHMAKRLREHLAEAEGPGPRAEQVEAGAEDLPFPDASFDTAVFTLVLCTVPDPAKALAETARILRPGGRMLFCEHVLSEDPGRARWQKRLHRPWRFIGAGCNCNRDTLAAIGASPLEVDHAEHGRLPKAAPIVRPLVWGSATLAPARVT